ncbi:ABC-2 type transport system permease protein [Mariniphaga anaerophila]|uniref:ABC-2 type transport system permease protein n=1 Tax=Mariniphaga anaerophila TaxID=1484053 RepID=A0A1M5AFF3_9BACT|nr:ABC transporter permease [Mariniphaga anaerophila]SHF28602.1 ABC-2 type transport system permease protein [Mariniphaga anaerophila]
MNEKYNKMNGWELMAAHIKKELKAIFSDGGAMLILIGAMLIYPIIYSIGYFNETMTELSVGVVDLDHTEASRKYTGMIDASAELQVTYQPADLSQAENLFMSDEISGVVLIPKGFQKDVLSGKQTNVALYADASYFLKYKNQFTVLATVNAYFSGGVSVLRYMAEGKSFEQAKIYSNPIDVQTHVLYNPAGAYGSFIMPGLILVIIQQTLLIGIGLLGGSFSESKASPFLLPKQNRRREIIPYLFGKTGAYVIISLLNIGYGVVLVHHWFSYPDKANMMDVLMLLFPFLLAVIFLGIGLSTLFKHRESAIVFMVFLSPIALFLTGMSWPVSAIPDWLVTLSKIMPSTTVVPAYLRLRTMGVGLAEVKTELFTLYLQAGIYAVLTTAYFFLRVRKARLK